MQEIPVELPILIAGGADDPVGGEHGMQQLAAHYEQTGHGNLGTKIYAGGRHEMFNETNRDEFTADLLRWIENALGQSPRIAGAQTHLATRRRRSGKWLILTVGQVISDQRDVEPVHLRRLPDQ